MGPRFRHILPSFLAALMWLMPTPTSAQAQQTIQIVLSESAVYGSSVTFTASAAAPVVLTGARLTFQISQRDSLYSETVAITPGTSVMASHTVLVTDIQLPPIAQLTYYWDFQDQNGVEYRSDARTVRYEDTSVPWEWAVAKEGKISVHTDGQDETVSRAALEIARAALSEAEQTIGYTLGDEIHIYAYPELAQLANSLRMHKRQVQDWVAAYAIPDQRTVLVAAAPGPELLVNLQQDLPHEITHLVVYAAAGDQADNIPGWFNEGLAIMHSAEPDPTLHSVLETAIRSGVLLSLETLCTSHFSSFPPQDAALAYAQSESIMRYLNDRYGRAKIHGLMATYAEGLSCGGAVERELGMPLAELEKQWHNSLRSTATRTPQQEPWLMPWIVVWVISLGLALLFIAPQPHQPEGTPADETKFSLPAVPGEPPKREGR